MDIRLLDLTKITFLSDTYCIIYENLTIFCFNATTQHPLRMSSFLTVLRQQVLH